MITSLHKQHCFWLMINVSLYVYLSLGYDEDFI